LSDSNNNSSNQLKSLSRYIYIIFLSFAISGLFALISCVGLPYLSILFSKFPIYINIIIALIVSMIFIYTFGTLPYTFKGIGLPGPSEIFQMILSLIALLLFLCVIPALIVYSLTNPLNFKKVIKICVFVSSTLLALVYYLSNRKKFKSPFDTISFFSGVCLGPVVVIEIFL